MAWGARHMHRGHHLAGLGSPIAILSEGGDPTGQTGHLDLARPAVAEFRIQAQH